MDSDRKCEKLIHLIFRGNSLVRNYFVYTLVSNGFVSFGNSFELYLFFLYFIYNIAIATKIYACIKLSTNQMKFQMKDCAHIL